MSVALQLTAMIDSGSQENFVSKRIENLLLKVTFRPKSSVAMSSVTAKIVQRSLITNDKTCLSVQSYLCPDQVRYNPCNDLDTR
jgi:hypothetical protein